MTVAPAPAIGRSALLLPPNRNRLLPISITLDVPKSGKPDFGGGEGWDEGGRAASPELVVRPPHPYPLPPFGGYGIHGSLRVLSMSYATRERSDSRVLSFDLPLRTRFTVIPSLQESIVSIAKYTWSRKR